MITIDLEDNDDCAVVEDKPENHKEMITIDLEGNDDCAVVEDKSQNLKEVKKKFIFKKKLIFHVRRHLSLYDHSHKHFSNVAKKDLVWQKIAKDLKSTVAVCKDTWFELRYSYQRHARRLRTYLVNGRKENSKRPAMSLESELMFLWRFIDHRKTCQIPFEIVEMKNIQPESQKEKEVECNKQRNGTSNQKSSDDDLILVEPPVELIVIDEDDDNCKTDKQFKLNSTMKMLISQIKAYVELYDCEHSTFKDYTRKSYIWNAIAGNLGEKATKLMKCWIVMQTRYEWEICQAHNTTSELQTQLEFLKKFILKNPNTVYKQSYYLKIAWFDPIEYFKDIYNLIVRMKKKSDIVYITDSLLKTLDKSKQYLSLWTEIAGLKGSTAGQCETTWLIMRNFYWELMNMRQQNYQLTDKWYFETIITELYAISKAAQVAKQQELKVFKQNKSTKKAPKRPAPTNATSVGAPSNKRRSPAPTTTQMTPTIINNLQSVPATNSTLTTHSTVGIPLTLPKITAAISLAPQALNTGTMQIKQISGPPILSPAPTTLSPAPQSHNMTNLTARTVAPSTTTVPITMAMSFNLPTQTKVTPVTLPTLIRPLVPPNIQPTFRNNTPAMISVRPKSLLRPIIPTAPITLSTPKTQFATLPAIPATTINSNGSPQITGNLQTSILGSSNSCITTTSVTSAQSIASYKITTTPLNSTAPSSTYPVLANTNTNTMTTTASSPYANNSQLPKISGAVSLLNPNEILIELISSQNGNQLVVHGPPLTAKYQLSMPTVAKLIREILAIPMLHNNRYIQPTLISYYWEHIANNFNLPVHICRACWNFLLENFNHFPQIAPLKELMKPFKTSLEVWKESFELFTNFNEQCVKKGWLQYIDSLPDVVQCIGGYPSLYQDIGGQSSAYKLSNMEIVCAWRTISLRFPKIPEVQEIWLSLKACFCQYMTKLEFGIDNKWPIIWWRTLARLKFLVEARYSTNEPFFYIISNKMVEEIENCARLEMKNRYKIEQNSPNPDSVKAISELEVIQTKSTDMIASIITSNVKNNKEVELGALITAIQKHPVVYGKHDNSLKYEAWKKVAQELNMEVTDCLLAFKHATEMYFAFKKRDVANRCRINEKYYKKLDEIIRSSLPGNFLTSRGKLNIKTPFELNQSVETDKTSNATDLVFPERYINDINMSNSPSNLVVKNWVFAFGNINNISESSNSKFKEILKKYLSVVL